MKIVILGAGALGSLIGAHLARAGEEVTLIVRGERAKFIREHGMTITGLANFTVPVNVVDNPNEVQEADVLLVAVKTDDMEPALMSVRHFDIGSVLSVQNGVLKNEQLARFFGWEKTLGAAAVLSGEVMPAGDVGFTFHEGLYVGELPEGTSERVQAFAATLARAGINVEVSPQIQAVEWSKYVVFLSMMAPAVLTRLETHKILKDPDLAHLMVMLARETGQLSAKLGIPLEDRGSIRAKTLSSVPVEDAVAGLLHIGEMMEDRGAAAHKVSTLQDLERGRRLEVREILGYAVKKGTELDLRLPTVETCYRILTGVDRYLH
jgi:2-dehydropantoate 2-reductase